MVSKVIYNIYAARDRKLDQKDLQHCLPNVQEKGLLYLTETSKQPQMGQLGRKLGR
jgi:hypothetical protein